MKTPAAVFEAVPVGLFSLPPGGHSGNLLLRLTGKMENRLRKAVIDRLLACNARRQPRRQAFLCSSDTWRFEFYLAKTCELEGLSCCLEAGFWDLLFKKINLSAHRFPGSLQKLPVLCIALNGLPLLIWDPFSSLHSTARVTKSWTEASQISRNELLPKQSPGGALVFGIHTPLLLAFMESFQSIIRLREREEGISGPSRGLIHL